MPMIAKPMLEVVKSFIKEDLKLLRGGPFCNWKTLSSQIFFRLLLCFDPFQYHFPFVRLFPRLLYPVKTSQ